VLSMLDVLDDMRRECLGDGGHATGVGGGKSHERVQWVEDMLCMLEGMRHVLVVVDGMRGVRCGWNPCFVG